MLSDSDGLWLSDTRNSLRQPGMPFAKVNGWRILLLCAVTAMVASAVYYTGAGRAFRVAAFRLDRDHAAEPKPKAAIEPAGFDSTHKNPAMTAISKPAENHRLFLTGVVLGRNSLAIVSVDGRPAAPYAVGDRLARNIVLYRVDVREAVIRRDGVLITLPLHGADPGVGDAAPIPGIAPRIAAPVVPMAMRRAIRQEGQNAYSLDRSYVLQYLKSNSFLSDGKILAVPDGGFRIVDLNPVGLFSQMGLDAGDVLKDLNINGQSVNAAADLSSLFQRIGDAQQVQLQIMRDGRPRNMIYYLR